MMYLASFQWAGYEEPLMVGTNTADLRKAARDKAIRVHGTGLVPRPGAMCSVKIALDDILIEEIEVMP